MSGAKSNRIEAARRAIGTLSTKDRLVMFAELSCSIDATFGQPSRAKTKKRTTYTDKAEDQLRQNPQGLRTCEIAKLIGQPTTHAFVTLKWLRAHGRAERHGRPFETLWTVPGMKPAPRLETIGAAYIYVLSKASAPLDARVLKNEARRIAKVALGKWPEAESMISVFSRLQLRGLVESRGANEHGPLYVLVKGAA